MKWLGRWLIKLAQTAQEDERENRIYGTAITAGSKVSMRHSDIDGEDGLNIIEIGRASCRERVSTPV
jgi:hypothetical protein